MAFDNLQDDPFALQNGPAPALTPAYSGECPLDLSSATASGAFVQNAGNAIDGDLTTFASFPVTPFASTPSGRTTDLPPAGCIVGLAQSHWQDTSVTLLAGDALKASVASVPNSLSITAVFSSQFGSAPADNGYVRVTSSASTAPGNVLAVTWTGVPQLATPTSLPSVTLQITGDVTPAGHYTLNLQYGGGELGGPFILFQAVWDVAADGTITVPIGPGGAPVNPTPIPVGQKPTSSASGTAATSPGYAADGVAQQSLVLLLRSDAAGAPPPAPNSDGTQNSGGAAQTAHVVAVAVAAGQSISAAQIATLASGLIYPVRVWAIYNDSNYDDNLGAFDLSLIVTRPIPVYSPPGRYLKVDWGAAGAAGSLGDRFLTRLRLLVGGDGAANGAIAFLSALGQIETGHEVDAVIPHLPLWAEDGSVDGTEVHEVVLDVPPLARGLIYYPDYLLPASSDAAGSVPLVNLYHLQAYQACQQGNLTMPASSKKRARVGVSSVKIYPWNDVTGPYDDTVASVLLGLSSLGVTKNVKTAKVTGGETTHQIAAFETERETKVKVSAAITDVNALHIILGGAYVVDPANANGGEVQYFAENIDDRAPYFRLIAVSSNGDGKDSFVFVKMKVDGNVSYQMDKDKVTELEFEATCYFDTTYVRQDGTVGGVYEQLFGAKGDTAMHS